MKCGSDRESETKVEKRRKTEIDKKRNNKAESCQMMLLKSTQYLGQLYAHTDKLKSAKPAGVIYKIGTFQWG